MTLWEVIVSEVVGVSSDAEPRAFGCMFDDLEEANAYADAMIERGYSAEISPEFGVYTAQGAVSDTVEYFKEKQQ